MKHTDTLIIGASLSGLACAAALQKAGVDFLMIDKNQAAGWPWHGHYERLHLHTNKRSSHLPYRRFDRAVPRYPSRQHVIDYINDYQKAFHLSPLFDTEALSVQKEVAWFTATNRGVFRSKRVIVATGVYGRPRALQFRGMEQFPGPILHSSSYRNGSDFRGKPVLVVGFGNSACEIAIDLHEHGAKVAMSVRSAVNVVPRDALGIPIIEWSLLLSRFSPRIADAISAPLIRWLIGDLHKLGLRQLPYGPIQEISLHGHSPVLDIGLIKLLRQHRIGVYENIDHIDGRVVHFSDGRQGSFDAIIAGIGYEPSGLEMISVPKKRIDDLRFKTDRQQYFGEDGLYFCGFRVSPVGQIREIASDALKIARHIAAHK